MREIDELKKKLEELQSETSVISGNEREKYALTNVMTQQNRGNNPDASSKSGDISREKVDGVKRRFRDRMEEKKRQTAVASMTMVSKSAATPNGRAPLHPSSNHNSNCIKRIVPPSAQHQANRELLWSAGEEMFQQMVFYERSLDAVVESTTRAM
jgi:hypothetical protein